MDHALRDVALLALSLTLGVGPVAALAGLLNRRDRRQAALVASVCGTFSGQALRSDVAIRVRCALFSRRAVVTVDLRVWSREEIWEAMTRLRRRLPSSVQLRLDGTMEPALRTRLTVERVDAGGELELTAAC